jgi:AcrR family transcriptional regulator
VTMTPATSVAEQSRLLLRRRVLDAVGELAAERPWRDVSMADVADRAGVSRQTLYNALGNRRELTEAYVIREADGFVAAVELAVREGGGDPRVALSAALTIFLSAAETHPLVRAIADPDAAGGLIAPITEPGAPVLTMIGDRLAALLSESWPQLSFEQAREVADFLVRLAISHAAMPSGTPEETAERVTRMLGPYLDSLVAAGDRKD